MTSSTRSTSRELTRQVDLRRERLFKSIHQQSDLLVQQIDECNSGLLMIAKKNGTRVAEERTKECKAKLLKFNS